MTMLLWSAFFLAALAGQSKPLPDVESFRKDLPAIADVRGGGNVALDGSMAHDEILDQYAYKEKKTTITLDSKGKTKSTQIEVFDVTRSPSTGKVYRRPVSKNGVPIVENGPPSPSPTATASRPPRGSSGEASDIQALYDIHVAWSEPIDGHSVIALTLQPKARYKPKTDLGKWQQHFVIRSWVTETGHKVIRQESEVISEIRVARPIKKGTSITVQRQLVNGEVWIPVRTEFHAIGSFMPKGEEGIFIEEFSDFKKFVVDVELKP